MSTLERLYSYAKATGAGSRENFTTEALAGAIRDDPRPMLQLLRTSGLLPPDNVEELELETQVVLPVTGVLDLVILAKAGGRRYELWCEVKVLAGESGAQLDAYLGHLARIPERDRPVLFTLGPHPIRDDGRLPFVSWHQLRRVIEQADSSLWRDFADYLAEVHMSDDFDLPIAARETAAMDDFRFLHGKVARLVSMAGTIAAERWPHLPWPTAEPTIRRKLLDRLATHQQMTVGVQSAKTIWLVFGVEPRGGEADLIVSVETWPSAADLQREILSIADAAGLGPEWRRSLGAWGGLRRTERLIRVVDAEAAADWVIEQINELDRVGVLPFVHGTPGDT